MATEWRDGQIPKTKRGIPALPSGEGLRLMNQYFSFDTVSQRIVPKTDVWETRHRQILQQYADPKVNGLGSLLTAIVETRPAECRDPMYETAAAVLLGISSYMPIPDVSFDAADAFLTRHKREDSWITRLEEVQAELVTETSGLGEIVEIMISRYPEQPDVHIAIMEAAGTVIALIEHKIAGDQVKDLVGDIVIDVSDVDMQPKMTRTGIPALTLVEGKKILAPFMGEKNSEAWSTRLQEMQRDLTVDDPDRNGLGYFLSALISQYPPEFGIPMFQAATGVLIGIGSQMEIPDISRDTMQAFINQIMKENSWNERLTHVQRELLTESQGLGVIVDTIMDMHPLVEKEAIFTAAAAVVIAIEHQIALNNS